MSPAAPGGGLLPRGDRVSLPARLTRGGGGADAAVLGGRVADRVGGPEPGPGLGHQRPLLAGLGEGRDVDGAELAAGGAQPPVHVAQGAPTLDEPWDSLRQAGGLLGLAVDPGRSCASDPVDRDVAVAGNSTSSWRNEPTAAVRLSHSTVSKGCTPACVNSRRTVRASPGRGSLVSVVCGVCSMGEKLLPFCGPLAVRRNLVGR